MFLIDRSDDGNHAVCFGHWVTSVHATGTDEIVATPIPASTLVESSPGEIPSAAEQAALKTIVQAYIELRYRALSVSDAQDFQQNSFGDLVSDSAIAKGFLSEEMGKLAV